MLRFSKYDRSGLRQAQTDNLLFMKSNRTSGKTIFMVIAPTLALTQTLMVILSLKAEYKYVRLANLAVPLVFLIFNVGYLAESSEVWNYFLGGAYILFNLLTAWNAWKLPT